MTSKRKSRLSFAQSFLSQLFSSSRTEAIAEAPPTNGSSTTQTETSQGFQLLLYLPIDIFLLLKIYLPSKTFRQLLNVSKHPQIRAAKSYSICYSLPSKDSWRYYWNEGNLQGMVDGLIYSKSRQLSLTFGEFLGRKALSLLDMSKVSVLSNLKYLTIRSIQIDYELLGSIHNVTRLKLDGFPNLPSLPDYNDANISEIILANFPQLVDVRNISKISKITLIFCPVLEDISSLADCEDLLIQSCQKLSDVSPLGKQKRLCLGFCPSIVNIDSLSHIQCLEIRECEKLRDISVLSHVTDLSIHIKFLTTLPFTNQTKRLSLHCIDSYLLDLSAVARFTDVEELTITRYEHHRLNQLPKIGEEKLRIMNLHRCFNFSFQPFTLEHVYRLEVIDCPNIKDVSMLGHIPILRLDNLYHLETIQGLGKPTQKEVILERCGKINDVSPLQYVKKVSIMDSYAVFEVSDLQYCEEIVIDSCYNALALKRSLSSNCQRIVVRDCSQFKSLNGLAIVPNIEVVNCGMNNYYFSLRSNKRKL